MTKQEEIDNLIHQAYAAIEEAKKLADKDGLVFSYQIDGTDLCAKYYGEKFIEDSEAADDWDISTQEEWDECRNDIEKGFWDGWYSSYFDR